jgi:hypothetical protein
MMIFINVLPGSATPINIIMKVFIMCFIILQIYASSHAQVISDTCRDGIQRQGHLKHLIDEFKANCVSQGSQYNYKNAAFSNNSTIAFLNKALETTIFNKYRFLEKSSNAIISNDENNGVNWGMVEVGFGSVTEMKEAIKIIKRSMPSNRFMMEVLTSFVLLIEKDTIILVYSEYADREIMKCFFNRIKGGQSL